MTSIKVSVVIPCYRLADVLPRAVASVVEQTLDKALWEIIIVDDASPDHTQDVAEALVIANPGCNIRIIRHKTNQYLAGSLNTGASYAVGRYILNLDADNMLPPNTLQLLCDELDTNREVDIVYGGIEVVEESGKRWISSDWPPKVFDYQALVYGHINQIHSSAMFRRTVWERTCGYRVRCRTGEDAEFWCRATTLGFVPYKVTSAPTLIYYNRVGSMSKTTIDWDWTCWMPKTRGHSPVGVGQQVTPTTNRDRRTGVVYVKRRPLHEPIIPYISISDPTLVSVVIPIGAGHERYLLDAIDSVWAQTFDYWECIVVNDTGHDLPKLPSFVRVVSTNRVGGTGPAHARNVGVANAIGKAIVHLDADDFLEPTALSTMYNAWTTLGEDTTYVYTDWVEIEGGVRHESLEHDCAELNNMLYHPNTIMVSRNAPSYDETLHQRTWEDWDYMLTLRQAGIYGVRVPVPLVHVRMQSSLVKQGLIGSDASIAIDILKDKWKDTTMAKCSTCGGRRYSVPNGVTGANMNSARNAGARNTRQPAVNGAIVHGETAHMTTAPTNSRAARPNNVGATLAGTELDIPRPMTDIEYIGTGAPTVRGKSTGVLYYFNGSGAGHVVKAVYDSDVPHVLSLPDFRRYVEAATIPMAEVGGLDAIPAMA